MKRSERLASEAKQAVLLCLLTISFAALFWAGFEMALAYGRPLLGIGSLAIALGLLLPATAQAVESMRLRRLAIEEREIEAQRMIRPRI